MLVELGLVEQRYRAVCEVLDGASVVDVARRNGVARQTVHDWLRAYGDHGMAGLADRSSKPQSCPHQMAPAVEVRILELRRQHPGWGPRTIGHRRRWRRLFAHQSTGMVPPVERFRRTTPAARLRR